jgi:hypothetical protein
MTLAPPVSIAPVANSSCPGTPSFRARKMSSGSRKARATSYATGICHRYSTARQSQKRCSPAARSFSASWRPASLRSRNGIVELSGLRFTSAPITPTANWWPATQPVAPRAEYAHVQPACYTTPMEAGQPGRTVLAAATHRAAHQLLESGCIFNVTDGSR